MILCVPVPCQGHIRFNHHPIVALLPALALTAASASAVCLPSSTGPALFQNGMSQHSSAPHTESSLDFSFPSPISLARQLHVPHTHLRTLAGFVGCSCPLFSICFQGSTPCSTPLKTSISLEQFDLPQLRAGFSEAN